MSMREIANMGATSIFSYVKIGLMIVFVAALFATIFATLKKVDIDIVEIIKKWLARGKDRRSSFTRGYRDAVKTRPQGISECENGMCSRKIDAGNHGALIKNPDSKQRKIVCSECAAAYVKTGWIPVMTWGDQFKSSLPALVIAGGATLIELTPLKVLAAPALFSIEQAIIFMAIVFFAWGFLVWGRKET